MTEFAAPGGGDYWTPADSHGHLLVIEVEGHAQNVKARGETTDAIEATVHDVTAGATFEDTLIFPKVLKGSLKNRVGQKVLATLGQGAAKPGESPPWILEDQSGNTASVAAAKAYLESRNPFAAPVAAAPTPAPAPAPAAGPAIDLTGKTPEQVAALREMGLA